MGPSAVSFTPLTRIFFAQQRYLGALKISAAEKRGTQANGPISFNLEFHRTSAVNKPEGKEVELIEYLKFPAFFFS